MPAITLIKDSSNKKASAFAARSATPATEPDQELEKYEGLAAHIERFWQQAKIAKQPIEARMLRNLRQRNGVYEPEKLAEIREMGGSEIYMMLTSAKCRSAESWLREILIPDTDRPWHLRPSPMPDLPPVVAYSIVKAVAERALAAGWEINDQRIDEYLMKVKKVAFQKMREIAESIAERHETKIADQLLEGGWNVALSEFIYDLVTFPAAFLKGPVVRKKPQMSWAPADGGQWIPVVKDKLVLEIERRSPFDIFPAPEMRDIQYGNLIDRYRFTREHLQQLIGVPGYSIRAIYEILDRYGKSGYKSNVMSDVERAKLEHRHHEQQDQERTIEALNFWGSCSGAMLIDWGMQHGVDPFNGVERIDPYKEYQIEAWKVAGIVFKAQINPDPLRRKPYAKYSFDEIPGSIWGNGLPDLGRDVQDMCNGAARAIANNAAIASGPQVEIQVDRIAEGEKITKPYPWKLWQTVSDARAGGHSPAVYFNQPRMNVQELLMIYTHFERMFDNVSGFPSYTYGDSRIGGAGRTASGLAQLLGNVGKGVRRVVSGVSHNVIVPIITRIYDWNMQHDPDPTIKGDLRVDVAGAAAMLIRESEQLRRKELLQATANPLDAQIMGIKGRAELLRQTIKGAGLPAERIVPDGLDLELAAAEMPPPYRLLGQQGPNAPGGPPDGIVGGGGTPEAPETVDLAGRPPQGVDIREATQGYQDGGPVRAPKYRVIPKEDGSMEVLESFD